MLQATRPPAVTKLTASFSFRTGALPTCLRIAAWHGMVRDLRFSQGGFERKR